MNLSDQIPRTLSYHTPSPAMSDVEDNYGAEDLEAEALLASAERDRDRESAAPALTRDQVGVPQDAGDNGTVSAQPAANRRTRVNYTQAELINLLNIMERIVPCDSDEWLVVADEHATTYVRREVDALKKIRPTSSAQGSDRGSFCSCRNQEGKENPRSDW